MAYEQSISKKPILATALLAAGIIYTLSPVDFVPELLIGPLGYIEDIAIFAICATNFIKNVDKKISMILVGIGGVILLLIVVILLLLISIAFNIFS